jgi:hypothetical protein
MMWSRRMGWEVRVARIWEKRNSCRILVGKPEGKAALATSRHSWLDNIKMGLGEIGWRGVTGLIWLKIAASGGLL